MSQAVLHLDHIAFRYTPSAAWLLDDVSLSIMQGDRFGITGANGCGKSTLLHIMTGLLWPEQGSVSFRGNVVRTEKDFQKVRPLIGYLLQRTEDQLFCPTVLDDVAFGPLNTGYDAEQAREKALQVLDFLGIPHLAGKAGCNLSGGEQKLAGLASVLALQPAVLLLDEPTNDLDPKSQGRLHEILLSLPIPWIVVTHDQRFLESCEVRSIVLESGKLYL